MQITVNSVKLSKVANKNGKGFYQVAEVDFGAQYPKKIMSFSNPAVFEAVQSAEPGDTFEITEKEETVNGKTYNNWAAATKVDGATAPAGPVTKPVTNNSIGTRSTYETPEERAFKQRLIVRQSSLSNAIDYYSHPTLHKANVTEEDLVRVAEYFYSWVYQPEETLASTD